MSRSSGQKRPNRSKQTTCQISAGPALNHGEREKPPRRPRRPDSRRYDGETNCKQSRQSHSPVSPRLRAGEGSSKWRRQDRKSVVSGKRVSGRVNLGGRRVIKKKKSVIINLLC